jgi:hypothetical protein
MRNPIITAYVTKFALTTGILKTEAEHCISSSADMIAYPPTLGPSSYAHGNEWHVTLEEALARAEEMRQKKIVSLKKQIARLEKLVFDAER